MKKNIISVLILITLLYSSIATVNNIMADNVRRQLMAVPIPDNVDLIDSISVCGKLYGCGNGMQYTGAILLKPNHRTVESVQQYYQSKVSSLCEINRLDDSPECICTAFGPYSNSSSKGEYIVVSLTLDREIGNLPDTWMQGFLDFDLRGH